MPVEVAIWKLGEQVDRVSFDLFRVRPSFRECSPEGMVDDGQEGTLP